MIASKRMQEAWHHTLPMFIIWIIGSWMAAALINWSFEQNKPAIVWMIPAELVLGDVSMPIPDHRYGEDPPVTLTRDPWGTLQGRYATDVLRHGDLSGEEICRIEGTPTYQDRPGANYFSGHLSDFLDGCALPLPPGDYEMQTWRWLDVWGVEKPMPVQVETFTILP